VTQQAAENLNEAKVGKELINQGSVHQVCAEALIPNHAVQK